MDKRKDKQLIKHMALALCTHAHKKRGDKKVCPQKYKQVVELMMEEEMKG